MAKFCPKCSNAIDPSAKFCPSCGAPIGGDKNAGPTSNGRRDAIIVASVVVLVGALFFAFREAPQRPQPPASSMPGNSAHADNPAMSALDNLPSDYNSLVQLGNQNMDKQEFAVAAECYRRALAIDGSSADVRTDYGACLHSMGLPDRAIEEFKKVLADHGDHSIVRYNLGIVYYTQNQPDSARKYWEEYLRLDPNGPAADNARQFLQEL